MLQSYDHSGEQQHDNMMSPRKRGMDRLDIGKDDDENNTEGKSSKSMRRQGNHNEDHAESGDGDDDENVDPPARERPAVSWQFYSLIFGILFCIHLTFIL